MSTTQDINNIDGTASDTVVTKHGVPMLERSGLRRLGAIRTRQQPLDDVAAQALRETIKAFRTYKVAQRSNSRKPQPNLKNRRAAAAAASHTTTASQSRPAAVAVAQYIAKEGLADEIDRVTDQLNRTGLSEIGRLLLAQDDIYGHMLLIALRDEHVAGDDPTGIFESVKRNVEEEPRSFFEGALVKAVFKANHIKITATPGSSEAAQYKAILERVHSSGISVYTGTAEQQILQIQRDVSEDGLVPFFVDKWIKRELNVDPTTIAPQTKAAMVTSLKKLSVFELSDTMTADELEKDVKAGKYDQFFASAYNQATQGLGAHASDPIILTGTPGTFSGWDFRVDTFDAAEEQGVLPDNIRAAGALDYVYFLGDLLGVYRLADALVLRWAAGLVDIQDVDTSSRLYRYWQQRDTRMSPEERAMLYKRVLAKGDGKVLSRMVVNESFPGLWHGLMGTVADYIRDLTDAPQQVAVSRIPIYRATQELQYNLSQNMTGMAPMQVTDMYMQLRDAFDILGAPEILSQLSTGRGRGVWAVIERLRREELGLTTSGSNGSNGSSSSNGSGGDSGTTVSPQLGLDVGTLRTLAVEGNRVYQWIADFDRGSVTDSQFEDFREAAEAWIIAAATGATDDSGGSGDGSQGDSEADPNDPTAGLDDPEAW